MIRNTSRGWRDISRVHSTPSSENKILAAGLIPPSKCEINNYCYIPHGPKQFQEYERRSQMEVHTPLKLFLEWNEGTGKRFEITEISTGYIPGLKWGFNGPHILKLKRIG